MVAIASTHAQIATVTTTTGFSNVPSTSTDLRSNVTSVCTISIQTCPLFCFAVCANWYASGHRAERAYFQHTPLHLCSWLERLIVLNLHWDDSYAITRSLGKELGKDPLKDPRNARKCLQMA